MDMELRNRYEPIVRQYRLDTQHMEEHGSVTKIYTNQGPYALKKIEGRKLERNNFLHHIQYLKEKGFSNYVPIYHATDGNYILSDGTYIINALVRTCGRNGEDNDQYHKMFQTLGTLHQKR